VPSATPIRADAGLRDVWVEGEVGRVTVSSAGHAYFTLKDERSQLACVFFRDDRLSSPFEPRTGCGSLSTAASTSSSHRACTSSTSRRSSRPVSATWRSDSRP
jgi:exonuclease VII large subunit